MTDNFMINQGIVAIANRLENRAKLLRLVAQSNNKNILDWTAIRIDLDEGFEQLFSLLEEEEDDGVLAEIEGEEELHPLDPDNEEDEDEDDSWHEGFDDV